MTMRKFILLIGMGLIISCAKVPKNSPPSQIQIVDSVVWTQNKVKIDTIKPPMYGLDALNYVTKTTESRSTDKLIVLMSSIGQITDKIQSVEEVKLDWVEKSGELLPVVTIKKLKLK